MGGLTSFLTGLAKGLTPSNNGVNNGIAPAGNQVAQPAGTCTTQYVCTSNTLYYQQNTCVQQPMQQCQYGCNGNSACAVSPQAASPYGVGSDGNACTQPPAQPAASSCTVGTWQRTSATGNGCITGWQCVPNGSGTTGTPGAPTQPTAQLSCQPQLADVGMSATISYACGSATDSAGSGFTTSDQLSGSTTTVITAPPAGDNTASFGLTCINQSLTASQQCSVQINQPSIVLVVNPSVVPAGTAAAIGWVTSGMQSCTISSPDSQSFTAANASDTSVNGVATTTLLTSSMRVVLNCQTFAGGTRSATTMINVGVGGPTSATSTASVSVSSDADGSTVAHGQTVHITWQSSSPPAGSAMSLWLVNKQTGSASAVIVGGLAPNGTYTWNVPADGSTCNPNAANVCDSDLVVGDTYAIEGVLYTPGNAYVGDGTAPSSPIEPSYGNSAVGGSFTVTAGTSVNDQNTGVE